MTMKRVLGGLCALAILLTLTPLTLGEQGDAAPMYAYFRDARWMRTEPVPSTPIVISVPERTLLRLVPVNEKYAQTQYKDKTGYIYYKEAVVVEYTDPHGPDAKPIEGFFGAPVYMRQSPVKNAFNVALLPTDVRFRITPVTDEYAYIVYEGEEGYVFLRDFVEMAYARGELEPYIAYAAQECPAYDSPCWGAVALTVINPYTPVTVVGFDGDHMVIEANGARAFVENGELTGLTADFAVEAFEATVSAKASLFQYPLKNADVIGAVKKNAKVTVSAFHGEYALVTDGQNTGYLHYERLKSSKDTKAALKALEKQIERIEAQKFLNAAFSMLEEGNPIVNAYNANCGGAAFPKYQYGAPYLFAGMNVSSLLRPRYASQNSNYYSTEKLYLGGFDCIGFARWLHNEAGMKKLPAISDMNTAPKARKVNTKNLAADKWADVLRVGDCIAMHYKGGYHVMMYIGTLREFGFTADEVGALAAYLDYPLAIHCGMNNFHTAWYAQYCKEAGYTSVTPPDGGVTVSIIGIPFENAPYTETMWKNTANEKTFYWYDLLGYNLTLYNPASGGMLWYTVYRNTEK